MWLKCVSYLWHGIPILRSGQQPPFLYFMGGSSGIADPFQYLKSDLNGLYQA